MSRFTVVLLCGLLTIGWQASAEVMTFRIIFGETADRPTDYSGEISLSSGKVVNVQPWRFLDGDSINGSSWTLNVKRTRFEQQPDAPRPIMTEAGVENVVPAGIVVTVDAPETASARVRAGAEVLAFPLRSLKMVPVFPMAHGDILVERAPTVERVSPVSERDPVEHFDYPSTVTASDGSLWVAWQGYHDAGDHVYARQKTASGWSDVEQLTAQKGDVFRTAIGEDSEGRIWVVWSERAGEEWHLYARRREGESWTPRVRITSDNYPNTFHRMVADRQRNLHLVWVGNSGGESFVYWSRLQQDRWSSPVAVSGPSAWNPEAAADYQGGLWVTWDSYRNGNYDIYLRRISGLGELGPEQQVTKSDLFQAHPTVAVDKEDRVWLAWHESGGNWGKDWTHEDAWRGTVLYRNRQPKIAVLDGAEWKQPATDLISAVPVRYRRYVQYPRITADKNGRIWVGLQARTSSVNTRDDYWAYDGRWEFFLTTLDDNRWRRVMPVPSSSLRPEGPLLVEPAADGVRLVWSCDNRPLFAKAFYGWIPNRHEIFTARVEEPGSVAPRLESYSERQLRLAAVHPNEVSDVERIRGYRTDVNGTQLRILRGDFHRHTEISSDGAGDGSIEDYFRYMLDAAGMDTGIVGDHNIGNDDEYMWWRTEKASDLFHIPGRYTPMFGYERSPSYPNGHRNVVFAQRGVKTLPIPVEEQRGKIRTGPILYPYLRKNNGIAMVHSSATTQGTDWGDNDPELEPLVELYQGYHASYEYEGAPRAESENLKVSVHGSYRDAGFWWNALKKGHKIGVQASSDHISTHASYTLIYSPSDDRTDILESMRARHAYAATDNIIVDYRAELADGGVAMMGDAVKASSAPNLKFRVIGTDVITRVDIIRDEQFVYHAEPGKKEVEFSFRDAKPGSGESYYYLRIEQRDRNLAWSSPIWVDYR